MKLQNVLRENNAMLTFNDLTSLEVSVLVRTLRGKLSYETATPNEQAIYDMLLDKGLLDSSYELSQEGLVCAKMGEKYGSTQRRQAGRRDNKLGRVGGRSGEELDVDDEIGQGSDLGRDRWEDLRTKDFD